MADIISILTAIKGKALDVAHFEILKSAYELQNQNIEQLKSNNEALKENNDLLKEKNATLLKENNELKKQSSVLKKELSERKISDIPQGLSKSAEAILQKCIQEDTTEFVDERMTRSMSCSRMEAESGMDELRACDFIRQSYVDSGNGVIYSLTAEGKKYALKKYSSQK